MKMDKSNILWAQLKKKIKITRYPTMEAVPQSHFLFMEA